MRAKEIMTENPACCTEKTRLKEVARMMVDFDCGAIPVVDNQANRAPLGVITDRDIVCRTLGQGKNPSFQTAGECMTPVAVTVDKETDLEECARLMREHQIRRLLVTNAAGACCGILAQADVVAHCVESEAGRVVQAISV